MARIGVLRGGKSLERHVSLRSGARAADALRELGHEVITIDAGPDLVKNLRELKPDVAFIAIHGQGGEDGTVQEMLDILNIPYTGSGAAACSRCFNKIRAKYELLRAEIATPNFYAFSKNSFRELGAADVLPELERHLGFPLVLKPASQGSALGVKFAASAEAVPAGLIAAFSYDDWVLLERHIKGHDLAVSVLEIDGKPTALPAVEAVPKGGSVFDFEARYEIGQTEFVCPAKLSAELTEELAAVALAAYQALDCSGYARVDIMLAEDNKPYVIEVDTVPGLTDTSLLPQAAEAAEISFTELVEQIVNLGLKRAR